MVNSTLERVEDKIEEQVVRYRELTEKRRILRERIERAESEKRSVRDGVYQRVIGDYRHRLEETEGELGPVAAEVQQARAAIQSEIREIDMRSEEIQDKIDEIVFRHRVGEYDAAASNRLQSPLSDEYERVVQRRRALSELLVRVDGGNDDHSIHEDAPQAMAAERREDSAAPSPAPQARHSKARPLDVGGPAAAAVSPAAEAFIDPKDWIGEFVVSESVPAGKPSRPGAAAGDAAHDTADGLSELADPSEEALSPAHDATSQPSEQRIESSDTLPILSIVSGPAAGKRLPLLPMTMTLGREVDNNIEIKDGDVARYHARISFEGGQYTIQDLEGSSGTFVDGQRISKTVISAGSRIRVGNSELKVELG